MNGKKCLAYRCVLAALCLPAIALNTGLWDGTFAPFRLMYYTVTNLLFVLGFTLLSIAFSLRGRAFAPRFRGALVMSCLLTTVVYYSALGGIPFGYSWRAMLGNLLAHLILPLMVLADWLLFCPKGGFRPLDPLRWLAVPAAYYGAVLALARLGVHYYGGARYPYPFLDPARSSPGAVLLRVALIAACWLLAGYGLLGLDAALAARRGRQKAGAETSAPAG